MHVLFVLDSVPLDEADTHLAPIVAGLQRTGHRASLVTGDGMASERSLDLVQGRVRQVPMDPDMTARAALTSLDAIAAFAKEVGADVAYLASGVGLLIGALAALRLGRPYVIALEQTVETTAGGGPGLQALLEQTLAPAQRVLCVSDMIARAALMACPAVAYVPAWDE